MKKTRTSSQNPIQALPATVAAAAMMLSRTPPDFRLSLTGMSCSSAQDSTSEAAAWSLST